MRRRFRASNYQSTTRVKPFICTMPMRLDDGWNQIQFNLSDFTRRAYGTNYIETLRVQVNFALPSRLLRNMVSLVATVSLLSHALVSDSRQLPHQACVLLRQTLFRRRATGRVQIVFTHTTGQEMRLPLLRRVLCLSTVLRHRTLVSVTLHVQCLFFGALKNRTHPPILNIASRYYVLLFTILCYVC